MLCRDVSASAFRRIRSNPAHTSETILLPLSIRTAPSRKFLSLESSRRISGARNRGNKLVRSVRSTGAENGRLIM